MSYGRYIDFRIAPANLSQIKTILTVFRKHVVIELIKLNDFDQRIRVRIAVGDEDSDGRHQGEALVDDGTFESYIVVFERG